jgi:hypothetical protein
MTVVAYILEVDSGMLSVPWQRRISVKSQHVIPAKIALQEQQKWEYVEGIPARITLEYRKVP